MAAVRTAAEMLANAKHEPQRPDRGPPDTTGDDAIVFSNFGRLLLGRIEAYSCN